MLLSAKYVHFFYRHMALHELDSPATEKIPALKTGRQKKTQVEENNNYNHGHGQKSNAAITIATLLIGRR